MVRHPFFFETSAGFSFHPPFICLSTHERKKRDTEVTTPEIFFVGDRGADARRAGARAAAGAGGQMAWTCASRDRRLSRLLPTMLNPTKPGSSSRSLLRSRWGRIRCARFPRGAAHEIAHGSDARSP